MVFPCRVSAVCCMHIHVRQSTGNESVDIGKVVNVRFYIPSRRDASLQTTSVFCSPELSEYCRGICDRRSVLAW